MTEPKDFSESTARLIDEEVRRIAQEAEERAADVIDSRRDELDRLTEALLERETLGREEIDSILEGSR
jgi:cell division protease FtsH